MLVPGLKAAGRVVELHEPHASFDQPPRQQALPAENLGRRLVQSVSRRGGRRFRRQIESLGRLALHAIGQLERFDAGTQATIIGARRQVQLIQPGQCVQVAPLLIATDAEDS